MGVYVDGFVIPIPKANTEVYRKISKKCGKVWMEHGALAFVECMGDDVKPGKWTSFPQAVKLKEDEVAWFSWIVYKSRKQRDAINAKVLADPRLDAIMSGKDMPFDGKRMIYGGFKAMVSL